MTKSSFSTITSIDNDYDSSFLIEKINDASFAILEEGGRAISIYARILADSEEDAMNRTRSYLENFVEILSVECYR